VLLDLNKFRFARAVLEGHVLQFALAAGVADGTVERVVAEQELECRFAGLRDFRALGGDHHAFGDRGGAGGLKLGNFFEAHDAHAAGSLEREAGVVAEGGNLDAVGAAGLNEQRARGCGELFAVDGECYVSHELLQTSAGTASRAWRYGQPLPSR
jgi:hypothetical protein